MIWRGLFDPFPVVIDEAALADADRLAELHDIAFRRAWSAEEMEALLSQQSVTALVARRASLMGSRRPVAFVLIRAAADEAEILTIAVSPSHRRRGLGRLLMEAALRRLYADRVVSVFLEVEEGNVAAIRLYTRLGFSAVATRPGYYGAVDGRPSAALVMRADLG